MYSGTWRTLESPAMSSSPAARTIIVTRYACAVASCVLLMNCGASGSVRGKSRPQPVVLTNTTDSRPKQPMIDPSTWPMPMPRIDCSGLWREPDTRTFAVDAIGRYVNLGLVSCPGYYTLVLFCAPYCGPCLELERESPEWLRRYENLVVVQVELDDEHASAPEGPQYDLLVEMGQARHSLPVAVLVTPLGQTRGPVVGAAIDDLVANLTARQYPDVLPVGSATSVPPARQPPVDSDASVPSASQPPLMPPPPQL